MPNNEIARNDQPEIPRPSGRSFLGRIASYMGVKGGRTMRGKDPDVQVRDGMIVVSSEPLSAPRRPRLGRVSMADQLRMNPAGTPMGDLMRQAYGIIPGEAVESHEAKTPQGSVTRPNMDNPAIRALANRAYGVVEGEVVVDDADATSKSTEGMRMPKVKPAADPEFRTTYNYVHGIIPGEVEQVRDEIGNPLLDWPSGPYDEPLQT